MSKKSYCLASGFKEDCMQLLSLFEQTNSIRFENFCTIWKEMKFAFIFAYVICHTFFLLKYYKEFERPYITLKCQIFVVYFCLFKRFKM